MVMACTLVRGQVVLPIRCHTTFFSFTVPCDFDTPISIYVGGKSINISPESFIRDAVPDSPGSNTCIAGAASHPSLEGSKLISVNTRGTVLIPIQDSGF
jgi:hypothetical protein